MKKTDVPKHPLKPSGKIKKRKKSVKVPGSLTSDTIILARPHHPHVIKRVREFQQRRRILHDLVVKRKTFFFSEIEKDFSDATGGYRCVDPFTSIREYIDFLEDVRVLDRRVDRYYFSP